MKQSCLSVTEPPRRRLIFWCIAALFVVAAGGSFFSVVLPPLPGGIHAPHSGVSFRGSVFFSSSGQLDPLGSRGINDLVMVALQGVPPPPRGESDDAWLLPDQGDDSKRPLLLGQLKSVNGIVHFTYVDPGHRDLLAVYSRFLVTEEDARITPLLPSLAPSTWRYQGAIPALPTPGDANHYTFLDHLRHLLAKDPTLEAMGLSGGLSLWLYRNTSALVTWANSARDDWSGQIGAPTQLMRRQIIRIIEELDGSAFAWKDLPPGTPWLVDPKASRLGLLESVPAQNPPGYLAHTELHLEGLIEAPGHTAQEQHLAEQLDGALTTITGLMQRLREDAHQLVTMNAAQLQGSPALSLLDDMATLAVFSYAGQPAPGGSGMQGGVVWIVDQLQSLASIPVTSLGQ